MKFIWAILFYLILSAPVLGQAQIVVENENKDTTTIIADEAFKSLSLRDQAKALKIAAKHQENTDNKKKQLSKKYTRKSVFELKRQKKSLEKWLVRTEKKGNKERAEKIRLEIDVIDALIAEKEITK